MDLHGLLPASMLHNFFLESKEETFRKHFYSLQWTWKKSGGLKAIFSGSHLLITTFFCITLWKILKFTFIFKKITCYIIFLRHVAAQGAVPILQGDSLWQREESDGIPLSTPSKECKQSFEMFCGWVAKEGCVIAQLQISMCSDWASCRARQEACPALGELSFSPASPGNDSQSRTLGTVGAQTIAGASLEVSRKEKMSGNIMDPTQGAEWKRNFLEIRETLWSLV